MISLVETHARVNKGTTSLRRAALYTPWGFFKLETTNHKNYPKKE